jgi:hypothetical protein
MFRKKTAVMLASVVLATGLGATIAGPSAAQAAPCSPLNGYLQGWDGTNTCTTFLWSYAYDIVGVGGCANLGAPNRTSYIWNNSNSLYWAWTGRNCTGTHGPLYAKTAGPMGGVFNNNIESVQRRS